MLESHIFKTLLIMGCAGILPVCCSQDISVKKSTDLPGLLDEASGLTTTSKGVFSLGDDDDPEIYRIDTASGEITSTIIIQNTSFEDKEALAADDQYIYISDFGNNKGDRQNLKVVRIPLSSIDNTQRQEVAGEIISFHYPEQKRFDQKKKNNAFDCEAMISKDNALYLFTKQRNDHQTTMYTIPKKPGDYAAQKKGVFNAKGRITGATLSPNGKTLLLLGYQKKHKHPFIWRFDVTGNNLFSGNAKNYLLEKESTDWQLEGIAFLNNHKVLMCNEDSDDKKQALYYFYLNNDQ